jgi:hypothetical protein
MAGYSTSSPPALIAQKIGGGGGLWAYSSVDADTVVRVANYITNGGSLGMKVGDTVIGTDSDTTTTQFIYTVNATGDGTTDLTNGVAITNTDSD